MLAHHCHEQSEHGEDLTACEETPNGWRCRMRERVERIESRLEKLEQAIGALNSPLPANPEKE